MPACAGPPPCRRVDDVRHAHCEWTLQGRQLSWRRVTKCDLVCPPGGALDVAVRDARHDDRRLFSPPRAAPSDRPPPFSPRPAPTDSCLPSPAALDLYRAQTRSLLSSPPDLVSPPRHPSPLPTQDVRRRQSPARNLLPPSTRRRSPPPPPSRRLAPELISPALGGAVASAGVLGGRIRRRRQGAKGPAHGGAQDGHEGAQRRGDGHHQGRLSLLSSCSSCLWARITLV